MAIISNYHQFDRISASPENGPAPVPLLQPGRAAGEFPQGERGFARRAIGVDAANPDPGAGAGISTVRPGQAWRPTDRGGPAPTGTLPAHPGRGRPSQGDLADRGACP